MSNLSPWTYIVKTTTETVNNSSALQNDDVFLIPGVANSDIIVGSMHLVISNSNATPDFKFDFTGVDYLRWTWSAWDTAGIQTGGSDNSGGASSLFDSTAPLNIWNPLTIDFVGIQSGGGPVTMNFRWAQNVATAANTQVMAGSIMQYRLER